MSDSNKDKVFPLKSIRHYDPLDDNITEEIQPTRIVNSRSSISKLKTSKSNYDPLSNQFDETNIRRRVSFSNLKAVKEFAVDIEKNTVWDETYEEAVHSSGSTTSASTSATVASESSASTTAVETVTITEPEQAVTKEMPATESTEEKSKTTTKKIVSLESESADKENVPLVLSQEPLDLTIKVMPFSTAIRGKPSTRLLLSDKRNWNETSDEMDLTETNFGNGPMIPVIDNKEMPIAESTTTISAATAAAAAAELARANASLLTGPGLTVTKKSTVNQVFDSTAQDMEFTCVMEETKLVENQVSPKSKPTAIPTAVICQQNVNLSDDMEITNLMVTEQEPITEPSATTKPKSMFVLQPSKFKLDMQAPITSAIKTVSLLQSPTKITKSQSIEKTSKLISFDSPVINNQDRIVAQPNLMQVISPTHTPADNQHHNYDHDISLLARQTNNIQLNGGPANDLSLISPINNLSKQSTRSSSSASSMSFSDSSKSASLLLSSILDTSKDNRDATAKTEIRNSTVYNKFVAELGDDFSITVNDDADGDGSTTGNAKNNTSMVFIDNEKCDFLVSHSLINCSNVVTGTVPIAGNSASKSEIVTTSSVPATNDSIITIKSPIQIKKEAETETETITEELLSDMESKQDENLIDKEFAEAEKLTEDTLKVVEKYKMEAVKILEICERNKTEFEAMTKILMEKEQILAVCEFVNGSFEKFWQLPERLKWEYFWKQFKTIKMHSCNLIENVFSCRIYGVSFIMVIEVNPDLKTIKNIQLKHSVNEKAAMATIEHFPHYLSNEILMKKMPNTDAIFDYFKLLDSESVIKEITDKFFEFMVPKP